MKHLLLIAFTAISFKSFSQINHLKLLIGMPEENVTNYFDSLNKLKSNPYYKIEKGISPDGAYKLQVEFSIYDEEYYTCFDLVSMFARIKETEICVEQIILVKAEYAQSNLSYIKDNFTYVSENKWEMPYPNGAPYKIIATFEIDDKDYCTITYYVKKIN